MASRRGYAVAPKVGSYRGVTEWMRRFTQSRGVRYGGPGKYDVGHRGTPLSQLRPGEQVRLVIQRASENRAEGNLIAKINAWRRKLGLFTRT